MNTDSQAVLSALPGMAESQKFLLAAARLQALGFKAAMRYQIEALSFLRHRCEQDMKFVDALVADDEFTDAFDVCVTFMQNAANEYAAEAGKMAEIGSRVASETARRVSRQAVKTLDDVAARTVA